MKSDGYQLLDSGNYRKLEQIGPYRLIRPSLAACWQPMAKSEEWQKAHGEFVRHSSGNGQWKWNKGKKVPEHWNIKADKDNLTLEIRPTDFGHVGIFPEHHATGYLKQSIQNHLKNHKEPYKLLNLFAYTGTVTLIAAHQGAQVVHVDASKTSVSWGKENQNHSGLQDRTIRWIVDDVSKFVQREVRRGNKYDGIILDPPSFGRGSKGELWKIEEHLLPLMTDLMKLKSENFSFLQLSSHSEGFTPISLYNLVAGFFPKEQKENFIYEEMGVQEKIAGRTLPSGAMCIFYKA